MVTRELAPGSVTRDTPMSPEYRKNLLKLLADHARAELWAAHTYSSWVPRAPGPDEKVHMAHIAHEEAEHWYKCILLLGDLGVPSKEARRHESQHWFYRTINLVFPSLNWLDVLMLTFLIDRGAYFLIEDYAQSSYAPWMQMSRQILSEEEGHVDFGSGRLRAMMENGNKARIQAAMNRWWRVALNMFGPPRTKNTDLYIRLGLKFRTNEDRRQAYIRDAQPQILALGLKVPKLYRQSYPFL